MPPDTAWLSNSYLEARGRCRPTLTFPTSVAQQSVYAAATLTAHESQHRVQGWSHGLCQQVSGGGQVTPDHADLHTALHSKRAQGGAMQ